MGLKTICAYLGHRAVYAFRATGRIMNLFLRPAPPFRKYTAGGPAPDGKAWGRFPAHCKHDEYVYGHGPIRSDGEANLSVLVQLIPSAALWPLLWPASWHLSLPVLLWPAGSEPPLLLKSVP